MKSLLISTLILVSVFASGQSLSFHSTEISLNGVRTTFKDLSIKMSELGDSELAKDFKKIHRRRENIEPGWLHMGLTSYTIGLWEIIQSGRIQTLTASYTVTGLGIALYDDIRQSKTERLIIETVDKYNSKYANTEK